MRVAWCTPFSAASAIGRVSAQVVAGLSAEPGVDVEVFHPGAGAVRAASVPVHRMDTDPAAVAQRLQGFDHVVYNLGNHAENHRAILQVSRLRPGVVVLHDVSLLHLMIEEAYGSDPAGFGGVLARWYGREGRSAAAEADADLAGWLWAEETIDRFSLLEPALEGALAVLTHSAWAADRVRRSYLGDVAVARLPSQLLPPAPDDDPPGAPRIPADRVVILQAGAVNPNKKVETVVEAFAAADVTDRAHLVVCGNGTADTLRELRALAQALGVASAVTVLGEVSDEVLAHLRRRADIATVLRHPPSEAASAVLVDSLQAGAAVVTVDAGCYQDVDAGAAVHVPVPPSAVYVASALAHLVDDTPARALLQEAGPRFVAEHHTVDGYVRRVLEVLRRSGAGPRRHQLAADLGHVARRLHADPDGTLVRTLAGTAAELFGGRPRVLTDGPDDHPH